MGTEALSSPGNTDDTDQPNNLNKYKNNCIINLYLKTIPKCTKIKTFKYCV